MALHRELNALAGSVAAESIDGARIERPERDLAEMASWRGRQAPPMVRQGARVSSELP
jgi:hypothetical protein